MMYPNLNRILYFVTTTVVDWVDVFTRPAYSHIVVDSLQYCQEKKHLVVYAWVLMSNHLHMIVSLDGEMDSDKELLELSNVIRDFKKFTSKKIVEAIQENEQESRKAWMLNRFEYAGANDSKIKDYRFWQEGYYVEEILTVKFLKQKIDYIHQNPVRREIVASAEEYLYSSAVNYAGKKGIVDVCIVEMIG